MTAAMANAPPLRIEIAQKRSNTAYLLSTSPRSTPGQFCAKFGRHLPHLVQLARSLVESEPVGRNQPQHLVEVAANSDESRRASPSSGNLRSGWPQLRPSPGRLRRRVDPKLVEVVMRPTSDSAKRRCRPAGLCDKLGRSWPRLWRARPKVGPSCAKLGPGTCAGLVQERVWPSIVIAAAQERPMRAGRITLPESCRPAARGAPRKIAPSDPNGHMSRPNSAAKRPMLAQARPKLTRFTPSGTNWHTNAPKLTHTWAKLSRQIWRTFANLGKSAELGQIWSSTGGLATGM